MQWENYLAFLENIGTRYFVVAGSSFLLFYVLLRNTRYFKKIQPKPLKINDYAREIGFSLLTMLLFAFVPFFLLSYQPVARHTTFYSDINQHGLFYFVAAFPLMALIHDTYFYWMHRLIHHKRLFRYFHLLHHKSSNPSPWAAYAFHPLEAILEIGIIPVLLFTIPIHLVHLLFFFLFMIIYNVYIHLGYELFPKGFNRHWLGKWLNTSVAHNNHHQSFTGNYALYFTFWDRLMGTMREDYDLRYAAATTRTKTSATAGQGKTSLLQTEEAVVEKKA